MAEFDDHITKKQLVKEQFGENAPGYLTSETHSKGRSLSRLVELLEPEQSLDLLDIATAAGHTAHALAPFLRRVAAVDITYNMLKVASEARKKKGLNNVDFLVTDAEWLPFPSESFDLVTCRIAAHHFPQVSRFMDESARVLRKGGRLAIVDNIVPGYPDRGRKEIMYGHAASYVNAFERLRDPSHVACLSLEEWQAQFFAAGFEISHQESAGKMMDLSDWAARMKVSQNNLIRLRVMLLQAPKEVAEFLLPTVQGDRITFRLTEMLIIGKLPNA